MAGLRIPLLGDILYTDVPFLRLIDEKLKTFVNSNPCSCKNEDDSITAYTACRNYSCSISYWRDGCYIIRKKIIFSRNGDIIPAVQIFCWNNQNVPVRRPRYPTRCFVNLPHKYNEKNYHSSDSSHYYQIQIFLSL